MLRTKINSLFRKKEKPLHKQIALKIPNDFRAMTFTEKTHHYPIQDRIPQEAFINDNQDAIIGIRHTTDHFAIDQLEEYKQNVFDKTFDTPNIKNYQSQLKSKQKNPCLIFSYTLSAPQALHIANLVSSHKETMLFLTFSCPEKDKDQWKGIIEKTFENIKTEVSKK